MLSIVLNIRIRVILIFRIICWCIWILSLISSYFVNEHSEQLRLVQFFQFHSKLISFINKTDIEEFAIVSILVNFP